VQGQVSRAVSVLVFLLDQQVELLIEPAQQQQQQRHKKKQGHCVKLGRQGVSVLVLLLD
jgi:hypothetical protein